jgi:hypothetical protein
VLAYDARGSFEVNTEEGLAGNESGYRLISLLQQIQSLSDLLCDVNCILVDSTATCLGYRGTCRRT